MSNIAAVSSIPLIPVTDGDESNVGVETTSLNKGILLDEGNVPNLTLAATKTTPEMQKAVSASEMITPVHQVKRFAEVSGDRLSLLPGDRKFETDVSTFVATDGTVDRPSEAPRSKKKKRGSKKKEVTSFYFDSENPPESVSWVQTDSCEDTWAPFVDGCIVPETQKQEWDAVFSNVSKLKKGRNTQIRQGNKRL